MKLLEMKCKNCGALLKVEENAQYINCQYCNTKYKLDDEVQHIKYDDMEKSGYEFEKGRIKAQQEQKRVQSNYNNLNNVNNISKKKNNKMNKQCYPLVHLIVVLFYQFHSLFRLRSSLEYR